ncbi:MAG: hypothetical protein AMXMBFR33_16750 [Candidatus Xenobia bacterium]
MRIEVPATLSPETLAGLAHQLERAAAEEARIWLLEGQAGIFCRGLDLALMGQTPSTQDFAACLASLVEAPVPTVALVDGETLGGGLGLAAACDLVLATPRSTFGLPECLFGLLPAIIMPVLLQRMSPQKARLLAMVGSSRTAEWAQASGLVDEIAPEDSLERVARRWSRDLARGVGAGRLRSFVSQAERLELAEGLARGVLITDELLAEPRVQRRVRDFVEHGRAPWEKR